MKTRKINQVIKKRKTLKNRKIRKTRKRQKRFRGGGACVLSRPFMDLTVTNANIKINKADHNTIKKEIKALKYVIFALIAICNKIGEPSVRVKLFEALALKVPEEMQMALSKAQQTTELSVPGKRLKTIKKENLEMANAMIEVAHYFNPSIEKNKLNEKQLEDVNEVIEEVIIQDVNNSSIKRLKELLEKANKYKLNELNKQSGQVINNATTAKKKENTQTRKHKIKTIKERQKKLRLGPSAARNRLRMRVTTSNSSGSNSNGNPIEHNGDTYYNTENGSGISSGNENSSNNENNNSEQKQKKKPKKINNNPLYHANNNNRPPPPTVAPPSPPPSPPPLL